MDTVVSIKQEREDKALLQVWNHEINRFRDKETSLSELINQSLLNPETSIAIKEGCVEVSPVLIFDCGPNLQHYLDVNIGEALIKERDIKVSKEAKDRLDSYHSKMDHTWTLRHGNWDWQCSLAGARGKSRLILGAAIHHGLLECVGSIDRDYRLTAKCRTKALANADWMRIFVIKASLLEEYNYDRGPALAHFLLINFIDGNVTHEASVQLDVEIEDRQIEQVMDMNIEEQCYEDFDEEIIDDQSQDIEFH